MRYLSVCSGIEGLPRYMLNVAASGQAPDLQLAWHCAACRVLKPESAFHKQGKRGRHAYCRECYNARYRWKNRKPVAAGVKRSQNLKTRYGLDEQATKELLQEQGGVCAICKEPPQRACVDHSHMTGEVRGILCHRCNVLIGGWDDAEWREAALAYLGLEVR